MPREIFVLYYYKINKAQLVGELLRLEPLMQEWTSMCLCTCDEFLNLSKMQQKTTKYKTSGNYD